MDTYLIIALSQAGSSYLSTATIHAVTGSRIFKAVFVAAVSDSLKLGVIAGITKQAIAGDYYAIAAAVVGGAIGNLLAMTIKLHKPQKNGAP